MEIQSCRECKHNPPAKKWPCVDCDMRYHDRAEPKKMIGADVLDKIAEEIEKEKKRQLEIALGINDLDERRLHLHVEGAYAYCLEIINKYREEQK